MVAKTIDQLKIKDTHMKKIIFNSIILLAVTLGWLGCKKENYPGGTVSSYLPIYDLRNLYKGVDLTLNADNMFGSTSVEGIVISDHSGHNLPSGLLVIEQYRRLGLVRGISIPIGAAAAEYAPGDSVQINIAGSVLKRLDGILQITGVSSSAITKIATGRPIPKNRVASSKIKENPNDYESTFVAIVKASFDPAVESTATYAGDKPINDGFDNITLHTEATATFANAGNLNFNAVYYGIVFNKQDVNGKLTPEHRIRTLKDVKALSSVPEVAPVIITGYMADVKGGDGNYEYMQFKATKFIDFSVTPYSVVVTNNAGATNPTGFPTLGWATGSRATTGNSRTFKFNLTSGTVNKGEFFYVGGAGKMINGSGSTSMSSSKWIRAFDYTKSDGDGFGLKTTGLFANSGNASGFAIFEGTEIDVNTDPVDVVFIGSGGSLYNAETGLGYRVANTDLYDKVDVLSDNLKPTPFYLSGTNTMNFIYTEADKGYFNKLGGIYDVALGKWMKARRQVAIELTKTSALSEIEGVFPGSSEENPEGYPSTVIK
jgi:hypothetical protein